MPVVGATPLVGETLVGKGLVGKIIEVTAHTAKVRLITDAESSVAAKIQGSRAEGIVEGSVSGMLVMDFVDRDLAVDPKRVVVTSGFGLVYPAGIPVGIVSSVGEETINIYKEIEVQAFVDFRVLEEVMVLLVPEGSLTSTASTTSTTAAPNTTVTSGATTTTGPSTTTTTLRSVTTTTHHDHYLARRHYHHSEPGSVSRAQAIAVGKVVLLFVIGALLQTLIISRVRVLGVGADLFLIMTVIVAVVRGPMWGSVFGFVAGLAADITYLQPPGVRSLVYVVAGYVLGMLVMRFGAESLWLVLLYAGGASVVVQVAFGLFAYVMGPRDGLFTMLGVQLLPEALLDALVAVPVYLLLLRLRLLLPSRGEPLGTARSSE